MEGDVVRGDFASVRSVFSVVRVESQTTEDTEKIHEKHGNEGIFYLGFSGLIVILQPQVCDQVFTFHMPERVFQLHQLNENVVFRIKAGGGLGCLEVERQPFLNSFHTGTLREIHEQREVEGERRGQDRIAAEEVDLDLHLVAEPAEDVDVIPAFFVVAAGRIVVDLYDV